MNESISITNIQRFSSDDGPGIRTTVFMTGCNMHCAWCHNPENFEERLIAFDSTKCQKCGKCIKACERKAHSINGDEHVFDRNKCDRCLLCVEVCQSKALYLNSYEIGIDELIDILVSDYDFYVLSKGGVTLSGGEPIMQKEALELLINKLKKKEISIALETALNYEFDKLNSFLDIVDLFIVDLKAISSNLHKKYTGMGNEMVLRNIIQLAEKKKIWIRIPIIPEVNMSLSEIEKIGSFLQNISVERVELVPYHKMGISKYALYGMQYDLSEVDPPAPEYMRTLVKVLSQYNLPLEGMSYEYV